MQFKNMQNVRISYNPYYNTTERHTEDAQAKKLAEQFIKNMEKYACHETPFFL